MKQVVIDASVAVKWVIPERNSVQARHYLNREPIFYAPDFLLLECLSAIQQKVKHSIISNDDGWKIFTSLQNFPNWSLVNSETLFADAYTLSNQIRHPVYDCLYLVLAQRYNCPCITDDRKFYDRVSNSSDSNLMHWFEDPLQNS